MDKRAKKAAWKREQRRLAREAFPLPEAQLEEMLSAVDDLVAREGCDHTLRGTTAWLEERGLPSDDVLAWLAETGGFCDCEVAANSQDHFEQYRS